MARRLEDVTGVVRKQETIKEEAELILIVLTHLRDETPGYLERLLEETEFHESNKGGEDED